MSTTIIIIYVILAACLVLPIYLFNKNSKNNTSKAHKAHLLEIKNHNLELKDQEEWHNLIIGIDTNQNKLLYSKTTMNTNDTTVISLSEIKHCKIVKSVRPINRKGKKENILEKLALEFVYSKNNLPNILLEFYDVNGDFREDFEMKRAEKWAGKVNTQLAALSKSTMVA